ncbi:MAG: response regulator [Chitinispirillales bacterium]|nr:response regulator [Chitinispirillales bacterium]
MFGSSSKSKKGTERLPVPPDERGAAFAEALNRAIEAFTENSGGKEVSGALSAGLKPVADAAGLDRITVYRHSYDVVPGAPPLRPVYRWVRAEGGPSGVDDESMFLHISPVVGRWWEGVTDGGVAMNVRESAAAPDEAEFLRSFGIKSMLIAPVFANGRRWGAVVFQYCEAEREFGAACEKFLYSAARLCASAIIRAETEAAAAEAELTQILIDTTPLSCIMFSRDLTILTCNYASVTLFEVESKEEVMAMFYELSPEYQPCGRQSSEMAIELIRDTFNTGYNEVAWMHQTAGGEQIPCETMLVRVKHRDDYVVAGYARDLRSIKEAEAKMRETDERTKILFDAMPLCACYLDGDCRVIDCNEEVVRVFGLKDKREYIDRFDAFSPTFQPDGKASAEAARELVKRAFEEGGGRCEWMHQTLGGEPLPVELTLMRVKSKSEYVVAGYMRDLREQKALENLARAEAANRAKSSFLATMSHEMRTPMNAIIGMTTIGKGAEDMERKDYALNKIEGAAKHLLSVINNVLDISKIEADKLELAPIEFNFERMLQRVIDVITFRVDEKRQRLGIHIDRKIPRFVVGDDNRLTQVIMNLLTNAVKFSPERGEISLEASLCSEAGGVCEVRVEVSDNGIGISPEQQSRLFSAFEQAERGISREFGGTGLGLAISKRIVELMGGHIWIESALGRGSKFIFTAKLGRGQRGIRSMLAPGVKWENMRVLAVDDEPETRDYFTELFSQLGIKADAAVDGFEACRLIEERGGYDIYFIDWRMPGMDGIELAKRIKERAAEKPSVAVMISAVDWSVIKEAALGAGISRYLLKPLFSSAVIDCVHECLGITGATGEAGDAGPEAPSGAPFEGKSILVAEDVEINREILILLLEDTGIAIDCAQNGLEAVDMVTAAPAKYDLIFMDVQMPKMDGLEATRRIRAQGKTLPIVAMTANVFKSDVDACLAAGMNDHIGKPIDIDAVMEKLRKYL